MEPGYTTDADHVMTMFFDKLENDPLEFFDYIVHCGIDIGEIKAAGTSWPKLESLILSHYRVKPGVYDLEQVGQDLASYPRMVAEIARLKRKKLSDEVEHEQRRQKAREERKRKVKGRS